MDKKKNNDETMFVSLPLSVIEPNDGQLEGLPANPRSITKEKLDLLKKNIQEYPEMLSLRGLMVYPLRGGTTSLSVEICGYVRYNRLDMPMHHVSLSQRKLPSTN